MGEHDKVNDEERGFEVGKDEAWFSNIKRTYDEYQDLANSQTKNVQAHVQKIMSDAQNISNQIFQNAVENANISAKQTIRHADIAIDRQWNLDEVSRLAALPGVEALSAALAANIAKTLSDLNKTT